MEPFDDIDEFDWVPRSIRSTAAAPLKQDALPLPKPSTPETPDLSYEQRKVYDNLLLGVKYHPVQTLGGYAGTGKSTVISHLVRELGTWGVCAFTGKAANQLRRKGIEEASTIHSLIYKPVKEIDKHGKVVTTWKRKEKWEFPADGFLVDEASMISSGIDADLRSFGLPIIYVGDHGQLEPIGDNPGLMLDPMHRLETIHRNAGNIARFAEHLRHGCDATEFKADPMQSNKGIVEFATMDSVSDEDLLGADQVICAFNATRCSLNSMIREHYGYNKTLVDGERVMCLRNNKTVGLFNGMQGTVCNLNDVRHDFDFDTYGELIPKVAYDWKQFGREKGPEQVYGSETDRLNPFDYAYCITCHKAQGDEWDTVIVIEQRCPKWGHTRWAYTAASRAKARLIWVAG